ncbi:MAG: hypothetical protein II905_06425, partial [Muribaculaceae bacterium]|nr:hypothetical protein [Muribaculaceae bacterium]
MEDFTLQKHNFEKAKAKILTLSEKVPSEVSLNKFQTEGDWIPWHDHKVTGEEINNDLVIPLQKTISSIKTSLKNLFDISSEVYRTFDYLDKDYIHGIIVAIDSAETASNQALHASAEATKAQEGNSKTIDALQATVKGLKDFRESTIKRLNSLDPQLQAIKNNEIKRLDTDLSEIQLQIQSFAHTNDVDAIKKDVLTNKADLSDVHRQISDLSSITAATTEKIHADLAVLQHFQTLLESYTHLGEVDATWADVQTHKSDLSGLHEQINEITSKATETTEKIHADLAVLQHFQTLLESYTHLGEVDATWADVQTHKSDLSG